MNLVDLETFACVAERGSLTAAASALRLPKSTVSRRVARLEDALGVALVHRGARSIALTEHGRHLWERSAAALRALDEAERAVRDREDRPSGLLRVTAPADIGGTRAFSGMLAGFVARWPEVRVELDLSSRVVDLRAEGFDVAVRPLRPGATWSGDGLRVRALARHEAGIYASVEHVAAWGLPEHPSELARHPWVAHEPMRRVGGYVATHRETGERWPIEAEPAVLTPDIGQVLELVLQGVGLGAVPAFLARPWVERGLVARALPAWDLPGGQLGLVWPDARYVAPKVRAFLDHVVEQFDADACASDRSAP